MKLEVGQFARTKDGYISQYKYYDTTNAYMEKFLCIPLSNGTFANIEDIVKASYNIIDILECGDYVNGNPVCIIKEDEHNRKWIYTDSNYKYGYLEEDIKSILTHEQFEAMAYKVGD